MEQIKLLNNYINTFDEEASDDYIICVNEKELGTKLGKNIAISAILAGKILKKSNEYQSDAENFFQLVEENKKSTLTWKGEELDELGIVRLKKEIVVKQAINLLLNYKREEVLAISKFIKQRANILTETEISIKDKRFYKKTEGKEYSKVRDEFLSTIITTRANMVVSKHLFKNLADKHGFDLEQYNFNEYGIHIYSNARNSDEKANNEHFTNIKRESLNWINNKGLSKLTENQKESMAISVISIDLQGKKDNTKTDKIMIK